MAQASIDNRHKKHAKRSIGIGTDSDEVYITCLLPNCKMVKMYYSTVYQDRVISFNIAESKSFIMDKINWNYFKQLIPSVDAFFENRSLKNSNQSKSN
jgi:hypothetical protein